MLVLYKNLKSLVEWPGRSAMTHETKTRLGPVSISQTALGYVVMRTQSNFLFEP